MNTNVQTEPNTVIYNKNLIIGFNTIQISIKFFSFYIKL